MAFKNLFIKSDESPDDKPVEKQIVKKQTEQPIKFPTASRNEEVETPSFARPAAGFGFGDAPATPSAPVTPSFAPSFSTQPTSSGEVTQEQVENAYKIYEKGFESLNQPGYDFFEYFKAVSAGGVNNPPIYEMALAMAHSTDPSVTKEKLLSQSEFYITEINKVFEDFSAKGNGKKQEIINQKSYENQALVNEVSNIREQIDALTVTLKDRESKLNRIDATYADKINDIDGKINANVLAKDKIIGAIQTVKNGISINIK